MQLNGTKLKAILAFSWVITSWSSYPSPLLAQPNEPTGNSTEEIEINFIPAQQDPPDRGTPPVSDGTGSRGECIYKTNGLPLMRLGGSHHLTLTINDRPTFWVYVPYKSKASPEGEFSLQHGDKDIYRTRFKLSTTPGVVSISLPATVSPLEVGKEYRWYFEIDCPSPFSGNESPTPASLTGIVQRVTSSVELENELKTASTSLLRSATYAKHGIWYEAITELAQLRLNEPQNPVVEKAWISLLSDPIVGLEKLASEPIVGSVK